MRTLRNLWQHLYDVRPGEYGRTIPMFFYLMFVLFAYYILKPVSRAMFLNKFDIDKLPYLYILVAIGGGLLAYLYSRVAVRASLMVAVTWTMALSVLSLVIMWWLIGLRLAWMIYVLNIWVGLFSIVLVSQGWLVASNLFTAREAKRLYGLLGMGMVVGAAFGGEFTRRTAVLVGTNNLLLASAVMVILAYAAFRVAATRKGSAISEARASESEEDFSLGGLFRDIGRTRHLQVIIGIMTVTYLVDVMVEFQFQFMAKEAYHGDNLTAFFGSFYGLWLNLTEFVFQFFLTTAVVSRFGVGGTLQILPVSILLSSLASVFAPGVISTAAVRLTEASTRYTLNRTGMELLYMPLPREMRNRVKAFVDIFVDRMSRGIGGMLLLFMVSVLDIQHSGSGGAIRRISIVVMLLTMPWIYLSILASREYIATIRKRISSRQLDLENVRIRVQDPRTVALLEEAAVGANPRQASYALELLAEAPDYDIHPLLRLFADSPFPEVRRTAYDLARRIADPELLEKAMAEIHSERPASTTLVKTAVAYVMAVAEDPLDVARKFLDSNNFPAAEAALESLKPESETARGLIPVDWIEHGIQSPDPRRRALSAMALGITGDRGGDYLQRLLVDADPLVIKAACRAAGTLRDRGYLFAMVQHLSNARVRAAAIESLAALGPQICGALGDLLMDETLAAKVRRQVPRVLRLIPSQRSADVLVAALASEDLSMRGPVLKAMNHLREHVSDLRFDDSFITGQIEREARYYFEMNAALAPFAESRDRRHTAASLLARSIEEELRRTLERLFRLLGLRYPPKEMYSAYLAVSHKRTEEVSAAVEFLDSVLDRPLKKLLLPLLDAPDHVLSRGRDLLGIELRDVEAALRELIHSRDPWLAACAMAAAAELKLRGLAPEIAEAGRHAEAEVSEVARSAEYMLA